MSCTNRVDKGDWLCDVEYKGELHLGDDVVPGGAVGDAVVVCARLLGDDVDDPMPPVRKVTPGSPLTQVHAVLLHNARTPSGYGNKHGDGTFVGDY